jgi:hypothetical protein
MFFVIFIKLPVPVDRAVASTCFENDCDIYGDTGSDIDGDAWIEFDCRFIFLTRVKRVYAK